MEWLPVAPVADVGTRPTAVVAGGVPLVLWRPAPSAEPVAVADRCPQENAPPPRADLPAGPRVRVADGMVAVAAEDLRRLDSGPDDLLTNVDPALRYAWHPVALASEWPCSFELLGDTYPSEASFWGVQERWGLIWVALDEPLTGLFPDADADDAAYVGAWLPPARTPAPAGAVADNFLDVAHFPFVHAGTFEEAVLAEDLALQRAMRLPGLPLRPRDELHVRADLLGVTLHRLLRHFLDDVSGRASRRPGLADTKGPV